MDLKSGKQHVLLTNNAYTGIQRESKIEKPTKILFDKVARDEDNDVVDINAASTSIT